VTEITDAIIAATMITMVLASTLDFWRGAVRPPGPRL
jgi:hypothetical protein